MKHTHTNTLYNRLFRRRDDAVSPVIGTILMVAVTVLLGVAVYAAVNGFGSRGTSEGADASFRASAVDANGNLRMDTLKITYIQGPGGIANADIVIRINDPAGNPVAVPAGPATWVAGDSVSITPGGGAGSYAVSVAVNGKTVIDTSIRLDE